LPLQTNGLKLLIKTFDLDMKKCLKCSTEKPLDQFYKCRGMADGNGK
jgi:hypothetical protein